MLGTGLLACLSLLPLSAQAEEAAAAPAAEVSPLSGNLGLVSEYLFRGIRQTWGNPAIQGGIDYVHPSGFYVGTWMSNTSANLYANATVEIDLYGGYRATIDDFTLDAGLLQFIYPGANYNKITPAGTYSSKKYNSTELYLSGTWQWLNLKYSRSMTKVGYFGFSDNNAYAGAFPGDPSAGVSSSDTRGSWYVEANINYEFLPTWTAIAHVGHQNVTNSKHLNYNDYKVGFTKALPQGWVAGLAYSTTTGTKYWDNYPSVAGNGTTKNMADSVWIASISHSF
jgi:uncharacterized protein (TIGR02001 family)